MAADAIVDREGELAMRVRGRRASSGGDLWRQSGFLRVAFKRRGSLVDAIVAAAGRISRARSSGLDRGSN